MTIAELERELQKCYGIREGSRVYRTVIPGILVDFLGMLKKAGVNEEVREEYRLEDGRGTIRLSARKTAGAPQINADFSGS